MNPRIHIITLGVDDLERSLRFYRDGLGFPTKGIIGKEFEHGATAVFELQGGMMLSLFNAKIWRWMRPSLTRRRARPNLALANSWGAKKRSIQ